jgi:hypothetical protein
MGMHPTGETQKYGVRMGYPVMCIGDFNAIKEASKKYGGSSQTSPNTVRFQKFYLTMA